MARIPWTDQPPVANKFDSGASDFVVVQIEQQAKKGSERTEFWARVVPMQINGKRVMLHGRLERHGRDKGIAAKRVIFRRRSHLVKFCESTAAIEHNRRVNAERPENRGGVPDKMTIANELADKLIKHPCIVVKDLSR